MRSRKANIVEVFTVGDQDVKLTQTLRSGTTNNYEFTATGGFAELVKSVSKLSEVLQHMKEFKASREMSQKKKPMYPKSKQVQRSEVEESDQDEDKNEKEERTASGGGWGKRNATRAHNCKMQRIKLQRLIRRMPTPNEITETLRDTMLENFKLTAKEQDYVACQTDNFFKEVEGTNSTQDGDCADGFCYIEDGMKDLMFSYNTCQRSVKEIVEHCSEFDTDCFLNCNFIKDMIRSHTAELTKDYDAMCKAFFKKGYEHDDPLFENYRKMSFMLSYVSTTGDGNLEQILKDTESTDKSNESNTADTANTPERTVVDEKAAAAYNEKPAQEFDEENTVVAESAGADMNVEPTADAGKTGEPTVDAGQTGEPTADAGQTGEPTVDAGQTGEPTVDAGQTGELTVDAGQTGEPTVDAGQTGEPTVDAGQTGEPTDKSEQVDEMPPPPPPKKRPHSKDEAEEHYKRVKQCMQTVSDHNEAVFKTKGDLTTHMEKVETLVKEMATARAEMASLQKVG